MSFWSDVGNFAEKHVGDAIGAIPLPGASAVGKGVQSIVDALVSPTPSAPQVAHEVMHGMVAAGDFRKAQISAALKPQIPAPVTSLVSDLQYQAFITRLLTR